MPSHPALYNFVYSSILIIEIPVRIGVIKLFYSVGYMDNKDLFLK